MLANPIDNTTAWQYYLQMIRSFADKKAAAIFVGHEVRGLPKTIQETERRKLKLIDSVVSIDSLRVPPGNRL